MEIIHFIASMYFVVFVGVTSYVIIFILSNWGKYKNIIQYCESKSIKEDTSLIYYKSALETERNRNISTLNLLVVKERLIQSLNIHINNTEKTLIEYKSICEMNNLKLDINKYLKT